MSTANLKVNKPLLLRVIFILNLLMCILPFIFYIVITSKNITIGGLNPNFMIYTGIAYIVSFAFLVYAILNKKLMLARIIMVVNVLIAIPAKAIIGIGVAIISMLLTFTSSVKQYFGISQ